MLQQRYYVTLAAAYVRGLHGVRTPSDDASVVEQALAQGQRLTRFKRVDPPMPRVQRVLGLLAGLAPASLLDVGSGRGAFLWPLLDRVDALPVLAIDLDPARAAGLAALGRGGLTRLVALRMDVRGLGLADGSVDGATVLEVLEHLRDPERAVSELLRVARRFVIASVPSTDDDNPEHIQRFDRPRLERLFLEAGARRVQILAVLNHLIALAQR